MWQSALNTYNDPTTNYLFFPEKLVDVSTDQIRSDLVKHKLALQPTKHTHIWTSIAASLNRFYDDDPREVLLESGNDAGRLIHKLQVENRARFPYLCGPKLSNYWPYILMQYTDAELAHTNEISIIPDTHVIQSSKRLGIVSAGASPQQVDRAWRNLLAGSGISPSSVHQVLWNWSRNNFLPEV